MIITMINPKNGNINTFSSYEEAMLAQYKNAGGKGLTYHAGEDDADAAAKWIRGNIRFYVNSGRRSYNIVSVCGQKINTNDENELLEIVKNDDRLTTPQKCWVIALLRGLNEAWMFARHPFKVEWINEYFRPLHAGTYGYTEDDDIAEYFGIAA